MKTTKQLLGGRIKELRKQRGISQEKLAEIVNVDPKFISFIECGRSAPSLETMEKIAFALNVEIKDVFDYSHLQIGSTDVNELQSLIQEADDETKRMLVKFMRALLR